MVLHVAITSNIEGYQIISHPNIWCYCNGTRSTFFLGGEDGKIRLIVELIVWTDTIPNRVAAYKTNDRIGVYLDLPRKQVTFSRNGIQQGTPPFWKC